MLTEDVKIRYSNFEPTQDVRSALYYILNKLHLKAPSRSLLSVTFTLTNGIFEGVIKVTSTAENFVAKATDVHVTELGQKLSDKLLSQMDKWKSLRFDK
jgi:hypothetical protein